MKRKLAYILILSMLLLSGCDVKTVKTVGEVGTVQKDDTSMFIEVEQTGGWKVVYHKETKVMYVVSTGTYNFGTFTLLVNADGTPMLWEE